MSRETNLILSLSLATAILGAFHSHLPPLYELYREEDTDHDPSLRGAEGLVAGLGLAGGAVLSAITRSAWPLVTSIGVVGFSLAQYEWGMRG